MLHEPLISAYPKETGSKKPRLNQENPGKVACFGQRSHLSSPGRPSYAAGSCLCRRSWWPRSPPSRGSSRTSPWRRCPPRASDRARTSPPSYAPRRPSLPFPPSQSPTTSKREQISPPRATSRSLLGAGRLPFPRVHHVHGRDHRIRGDPVERAKGEAYYVRTLSLSPAVPSPFNSSSRVWCLSGNGKSATSVITVI